MKKAKTNQSLATKDDALPEYNFRGKKGVRGKYYRAYRRGHTVRIMEDLHDLAIVAERRKEKIIILEDMKRRLRR